MRILGVESYSCLNIGGGGSVLKMVLKRLVIFNVMAPNKKVISKLWTKFCIVQIIMFDKGPDFI